MNAHDSEKMLGVLSWDGYTQAEKPDNADLIVFNTCAVREKAEQKFYSQLGRIKLLKNKRKNLKIVVVGCVAQESQNNIFKKVPFVDFVLGPQNIHLIKDIVSEKLTNSCFDDNTGIAVNELIKKRKSKIKAWVSIMYGCNNFCSYCIVPYTRGREISRPSNSILSEIKELKESGYKEITLLGQNVNSYKSDLNFTGLLRKIDAIDINRVRFVTSHPRDFSLDLIEAVSELPSICEHLHLPIQSGSDRILKLMNRGYTYKEYAEKIHILRKILPHVAITTDIIAGFPGETEDDFKMSVNALKELEFDGIFAFKFSSRKGTKAYELDNHMNEEVKAERLNNILKIQEEITHKKNKVLEGTTHEILIEGSFETDRDMIEGRTRTNKIVIIRNSLEATGSFIKVNIQKVGQHSLYGINTDLKRVGI